MKRLILGALFMCIYAASAQAAIVSQDFNGDVSDWQFNGDAVLDSVSGVGAVTHTLVPPDTAAWYTGSIFYKTPIRVNKFQASFDIYIGSFDPLRNDGADGMTFAVIDASKHGYDSIGRGAGWLGYGNLSGMAVEFDTYSNNENNIPGYGFNDPDNNHVALDLKGSITSAANEEFNNLILDRWHRVEVDFDNGNIDVFMTGENGSYSRTEVLSYDITNFESYDGYFGFIGAAGMPPDYHLVDNFSLTTQVVPEPASATLFIIGSGAIAHIRRRKKRV